MADQTDRCTMEERVITQVKKWVCFVGGRGRVTSFEIVWAAWMVLEAWELNVEPGVMERCGAQEVMGRAMVESSSESSRWRTMVVLSGVRLWYVKAVGEGTYAFVIMLAWKSISSKMPSLEMRFSLEAGRCNLQLTR